MKCFISRREDFGCCVFDVDRALSSYDINTDFNVECALAAERLKVSVSRIETANDAFYELAYFQIVIN